MEKKRNPQIGLMITLKGVGGCAIFGKTLKERQKSLALLDLLESELIQVQEFLDHRIEVLRERNEVNLN